MTPTIHPTEQTSLLPIPPYNASSQFDGYLQVLLSSFTYPIVVMLVRYATTKLSFPLMTSLLLRSIIQTALAAPLLSSLQATSFRLSKSQILLLITSAVLGAAHFLFMYAALLCTPLATVVTIQSVSTPLTAFVCAIFLGEGVRKSEIVALAASTLGVVLIAHPQNTDFDNTATLGIAFSTISAIISAFWCMFLRAMGDVHVLLRVLCLSLCLGLETAIFTRSSDWAAIIQNSVATALVSAASVLSFGTMMAFNAGMKRCRAGPALLVMTLSIPFSFVLGWLCLGESAGWFTLLGAALVIGSAGVVALQAVFDERHNEQMETL